jgi:hypothetical protein
MNVILLALGLLVTLVHGAAPHQAAAKDRAAGTVTVTLVRWPFT